MAVVTKNTNTKTRTKSAKIVLWSLLGLIVADLIAMLIIFIIAANGGTGTSYGGILGTPFEVCTTVLSILAVVLVMAWLLTEPSFKKTEVEEEKHDLDYRTQYVRKAANPHPMAGKTAPAPAAPKPDELTEEAEAKEKAE